MTPLLLCSRIAYAFFLVTLLVATVLSHGRKK